MLSGLFAMLGMIAVTVLCEDYAQRKGINIEPAYQMAISIGLVCGFWSCVLALRAINNGEDRRRAIWLFNFATLPPAVYAGAYWFNLPDHKLLDRPWVNYFYLPVIFPMIAIIVIGGTLMVPRVMRWVGRLREKKGCPEFSLRQRRVRYGILWTIWIAIVLAIAPVPLFIHALSQNSTSLGSYPRNPPKVLDYTPDFYRDAADSVLSLVKAGRSSRARSTQLSQGYCSPKRLRLRAMDSDDEIGSLALYGLSKRDAAGSAEAAWQRMETLIRGTSRGQHYYHVQRVIASDGTIAQRKMLLERGLQDPVTYPLDGSFFFWLSRVSPKPELLPLLAAHFQSGNSNHEYAVLPMLAWQQGEEGQKLLTEVLDSSDARARNLVLSHVSIYQKPQHPELTEFFFKAVTHKNILVRQAAWAAFYVQDEKEARLFCTKRFLNLMNDPDIVQRRAAAHFFVERLGIHEFYDAKMQLLVQRVKLPYTPANANAPVETGGTPVSVTPDELEAIQAIENAAKEWLKKQE